MPKDKSSKFSLVKVVIVLVVVGLLIGASMTGFSTFHESGAIKVLSEIEKFEDATKEFKSKYSYLPGDLPSALAMQLAFTPRSGAPGRGDGNGLVEGVTYPTNKVSGVVQSGEPLFFWEDLFSSGMIKDTAFNTAADVEPGKDIIVDNMYDYLPKVGTNKGEGLYVYSDKKVNYFAVSSITSINGTSGVLASHPGLSVREAYDIDKKIDDGNPMTGNVLARYVDEEVKNSPVTPTPTAKSCMDKVSGGYSINVNDGKGINCGLSFVIASH